LRAPQVGAGCAGLYNALVLAWGDVRRLASEQKPAAEVQGELI